MTDNTALYFSFWERSINCLYKSRKAVNRCNKYIRYSTVFQSIIDVSSKSNVNYLMLPDGSKHSNFSVVNSRDGSSQLVKRIVSVMTSLSLDTVLIGLESTSVYGDNLVYFLREDATLASFDRKIHVLNPKQVKRFKNFYNDLPKNDYVDSFVIADCLRFGRINKEVYIGDYRYQALQNLTRARFYTVFNLIKVSMCCLRSILL